MDQKELCRLLLDNDDSDIRVCFETEEAGYSLDIPAHRFILKRTSPVFKSMLENDRFEESKAGLVRIQVSGDVSVGLHFIRYLYTKTLADLELDLYIILMKMGHLYQVTQLTDLCENRIGAILEPLSVCRIYQALDNIASSSFLSRCITLMLRSAFIIFMNCRHSLLHERTMKILLKSDKLTVLDENQVVEALWHWGRMRCIQENKQGNVSTRGTVEGLLSSVRWCFVRNEEVCAPWFDLVRECKKKWPDCRERTAFSESDIPLKKYCKAWNVSREFEMAQKMDFRREGKYQLMLFTVNRSVVLNGLRFAVALKSKCSWKDSLEISLNHSTICDLAWSKLSSRNFYHLDQQPTNNVYTYCVEIELLKPVVIPEARINVISMHVNERCSVAFPQFSKPLILYQEEPRDGVFNVYGKVSSLLSVHYFIK